MDSVPKGKTVPISNTTINPYDLWHYDPNDKNHYYRSDVFFRYTGSFTTPPCTEGVTWILPRYPAFITVEQWDVYRQKFPVQNARPSRTAIGGFIQCCYPFP